MILLITMVVLSLSTVMAQVKDGKLIFERKINMHKMITDPEMRRNIPEFRSEKFELVLMNKQPCLKPFQVRMPLILLQIVAHPAVVVQEAWALCLECQKLIPILILLHKCNMKRVLYLKMII